MKLNLGCGQHAMTGWVNIDLEMPNQYPDKICYNLSKGLPDFIPSGSVDYIFSEHFIEHIERPELVNLLKHCHRAMKPGAVIRISTPNLDALINFYQKKKIDAWAPTWVPATPCQMFNEGVRFWGHLFIYNFEELKLVFEEAGGFGLVEPKPWRNSSIPELNALEVRPHVNDLIVEAVRL